MTNPVFSVSDAVAVINQTLSYAYPTITIVGELANFKIAKQRWVYADLKDDESKLRCFGTIYQMPGPLEDGMMLEVVAEPRMHPQFGFSLNIKSMRPVGEGSIKKAANLLQAKLEREGLFAPDRKRSIPYAPAHIGLIASEQSAAYADFIKIMHARWQGVQVDVYDAQVQGEAAPESLIAGLQYFNQQPHPPEVLVMIRGGGSADDLSAFNVEQVVRAVAASRIPTTVAIGHEIDTSLSELAADLHASTPSNAAELLFPDKNDVARQLKHQLIGLKDAVAQRLQTQESALERVTMSLSHAVEQVLTQKSADVRHAKSMLESVHPKSTLKRGYALLQSNGKLIASVSQLQTEDSVDITLKDGGASALIKSVKKG